MPDNNLYEYAILRLVPRVEREEFMNIGVVLFCKARKYLKVKYALDDQRILSFSASISVDEVQCYLQAFDNICQGTKQGGPIAQLPIPERFRWLTATRSTVIQASKVHPGMCDDPGATLEHLFSMMVAVEET